MAAKKAKPAKSAEGATKSSKPPKSAAKRPKPAAAKPGKVRKQYTPEQRAAILAEASAQKLTGKQVAKKYGISLVTYYLWRSKAGKAGRGSARRGRPAATGSSAIESSVREAVRSRIQEAIPGIVRDEVGRYLDQLLGGSGRRR